MMLSSAQLLSLVMSFLNTIQYVLTLERGTGGEDHSEVWLEERVFVGMTDLLTEGVIVGLSEGTRVGVVECALVGFSECTCDGQTEYSVMGLIEGGLVGPTEDSQVGESVGE